MCIRDSCQLEPQSFCKNQQCSFQGRYFFEFLQDGNRFVIGTDNNASIRCRTSSEVIERYRAELREDVELFTYIQYLFFRQWEALKAYICLLYTSTRASSRTPTAPPS